MHVMTSISCQSPVSRVDPRTQFQPIHRIESFLSKNVSPHSIRYPYSTYLCCSSRRDWTNVQSPNRCTSVNPKLCCSFYAVDPRLCVCGSIDFRSKTQLHRRQYGFYKVLLRATSHYSLYRARLPLQHHHQHVFYRQKRTRRSLDSVKGLPPFGRRLLHATLFERIEPTGVKPVFNVVAYLNNTNRSGSRSLISLRLFLLVAHHLSTR